MTAKMWPPPLFAAGMAQIARPQILRGTHDTDELEALGDTVARNDLLILAANSASD
jgi:hypothetical protein